MTQLEKNYQLVQNKIKQLANENARKVTLIAVSKTFTHHDINQLYNLGQIDFAENYAQELYEKANQLSELNIRWHFIGNLQSNKIKLINHYASWVHSLTTEAQAILLNKTRPNNLDKLNVLIEVNISHDDKKHGLTNLDKIIKLAKIVNSQKHLVCRGIMGIASQTEDENQIKQQFQELHDIFVQLKQHIDKVDTLSMGMSNDYELAIKSGSTHVRIGSLIFGSRKYKNHNT